MGAPGLPSWAKAPEYSGRIYLEIEKPEGRQKMCIDEKSGYVLGRNGKDCDIVIPDKTCSRVHACLAYDKDGRLHIADLNSVHGTHVNNKELEPGSRVKIQPGEVTLRLGSCEWILRVVELPTASAHELYSRKTNKQESQEADDVSRPPHGNRAYAQDSGGREARERPGHESRDRHSYSRRSRTEHASKRDPDEGRRRHEGRDHADAHRKRPPKDRERLENWRGKDSSEYWIGRDRHERQRGYRESKQSAFEDQGPSVAEQALRPQPLSGSGISAAAQKRKLLWGNKVASGDATKDGENAYGANRWDEAMFSNDADKQKFIKLMGVKANAGQEPSQQSLVDDERENLSADQHAKVLTDVETHFMQGLRRADGRKVGLGL